MKIEIIRLPSLSETTSCMTCFEAPAHVRRTLANQRPINGICIIDNIAIKFHFSPNGMDGDIYTDNLDKYQARSYRTIIKHLVPLWYYDII